MKPMKLWKAGPAIAAAFCAHAIALPAATEYYEGFCEASAGVALGSQHFAVAEDESNALMIYRLGSSKPARPSIPLSKFLKTKEKASDLEAAARVGDIVYWVSSHSITSGGNSREWRRRLFATTVDSKASPPSLNPVGKPYVKLLDDLIGSPALKELGLDKAAKIKPEAAGGLNIEGLAAASDGGLLLGFRNPLIEGKALVVPFPNPGPVVHGKEVARFGAPILLDLGERGIRSIDRIGDSYLIVAGPVADAGTFALYEWTGLAKDPAVNKNAVFPDNFSPEALVVLQDAEFALVLSDDGARCDAARPRFQAVRVPLK